MKYDSMSIMNKCNVDILSEDQLIYLQVSQNKKDRLRMNILVGILVGVVFELFNESYIAFAISITSSIFVLINIVMIFILNRKVYNKIKCESEN